MLSQKLVNQIQTTVFGYPIKEGISITLNIVKDWKSNILIVSQEHIIKAISNQLQIDRDTETSLNIESENVDSLISIANQLKLELEQQGFEVEYYANVNGQISIAKQLKLELEQQGFKVDYYY